MCAEGMAPSGRHVRKSVLILGGRKKLTNLIKLALGTDLLVKYADPARKIRAGKHFDLIILPCEFNCSLDGCFPKFKSLHLYQDIPFVLLAFLPLSKKAKEASVYALSLFGIDEFSPAQAEIVNRLISHESYVRSVITQLHPGDIVSKILALQTRIIENPDQVFDLRKSAQAVRLSPSWLSHKFGEISGIKLETFLIKSYLCAGLWKIISSDKPIKSIAGDLGYKPLSFSETFKKHFGASPTSVRKDFRGPKRPPAPRR